MTRIFRSGFNRVLHRLARVLPGAQGLRSRLHRMRGVKIGENVFIGDEVYIENQYPERVQIEDKAQIGIRSIILAHTRGPGNVIIEKGAFIGPNVVIVASAGRTLRVGEGSVVSGTSLITTSVKPFTFVAPPRAEAVAAITVPLSQAGSVEAFLRGLRPLSRK